MAVRTDTPQIALLKKAVEEKLGYSLKTHSNFMEAVSEIEDAIGEQISETTMERIWEYSRKPYETTSVKTLNVLSVFAGHGDWEQFLAYVKETSGTESGFVSGKTVDVASLEQGTRLLIGWLPDRQCEMKYLGDFRFIVEKSVNASIHTGTVLECRRLQTGLPAYMDLPDRKGSCYVAGQKNGLTTLKIL